MKKLILLIIILLNTQILCSQKGNNLNNLKVDDIYILQNIEDCFIQIDNFLDDTIKASIKLKKEKDFATQEHRFGLGLWIRNNWRLWEKGSKLTKYFNDMGIFHPDEISNIILISYHRYLNNIDINIEEQIKKHNLSMAYFKESLQKDYQEGEKEIQIDKCLDSGGSWIYEENICKYK